MTSLCLFGAVGRPHLYSSKGSFYFYIITISLLWFFIQKGPLLKKRAFYRKAYLV